jgi:hypothetical protein
MWMKPGELRRRRITASRPDADEADDDEEKEKKT